ncbi:unnamed protein product [Rodentolepis nana]|uniref:Small acidic protein-like domain-containing protein n=1 Tax=Rodentolepis nana TaxID=102285 RepID=A0A3P7T5K2_RODNA|nr:unnamed protein product [Rodentolepis nana]
MGNLQNNKERPKKEPIRLKNKLLTTDFEIANYFARFYFHKQKKNPFVRKSLRDLKIQVRQMGEIKEDMTTPNNVLTKPFRPCELNAAIKQLKCKKSPGEDGIHPEFLIRMGPKAKETMLTLFNKICETSLVPKQWKVAIVIPVLKRANTLATLTTIGEYKSNPQDALARFQETQMAQVRAKAEAAAAAANLPSYYNPLSVNAAKMAEQQQKRKLLWSKKSRVNEAFVNSLLTHRCFPFFKDAKSNLWKTTSLVAGKGDSVAAAKFCKLMGIHDVGELNTEKPGASTSKAREQADLFRKLEQEYEQSRTLTHTQRGVGLGYSSAMTDFNAYSAMRQGGAGNDPDRLNDE